MKILYPSADGTLLRRIVSTSIRSSAGGGSSLSDPSLETQVSGVTRDATTYFSPFIYKNGALDRTLVTGGYVKANVPYYYLRDHQGNIRQVVNGNTGAVAQESHYYPYGGLFGESSATALSSYNGCSVSPYKFGGKEQVDLLDCSYLDFSARMYDYQLGRFWTPDPLEENNYYISTYSYCQGNPINFVDLDGRQGFLVHGTWSNRETWKQEERLKQYCNIKFGKNNVFLHHDWSGDNNRKSRSAAAQNLISKAIEARKNISKDEPLTLVAHSHGGNVCIEAINLIVEKPEFEGVIINLLTINTPVRDDYQLSEEAAERVNHYNVYDEKDPVQIMGGYNGQIPSHNLNSLENNLLKLFIGEYGKAGRTFPNAHNIPVNNPQGFSWKFLFGKERNFHNSHNRLNDWINK